MKKFEIFDRNENKNRILDADEIKSCTFINEVEFQRFVRNHPSCEYYDKHILEGDMVKAIFLLRELKMSDGTTRLSFNKDPFDEDKTFQYYEMVIYNDDTLINELWNRAMTINWDKIDKMTVKMKTLKKICQMRSEPLSKWIFRNDKEIKEELKNISKYETNQICNLIISIFCDDIEMAIKEDKIYPTTSRSPKDKLFRRITYLEMIKYDLYGDHISYKSYN